MSTVKNTLMLAREEIVGLRRRNEILQAKVDTMDLFHLVLRTSPTHQSIGASEDVVYHLNYLIEEADRERVAPVVAPARSARSKR